MYRAVGDEPDQFIVGTTPRTDPVAPTADQLLTMAASGGCTQYLPAEGGAACLNKDWIPLLAGCKFGNPAPQGVSAGTWKNFCAKSQACAWPDFPFCPGLDAQLGLAIPACMSSAQLQFLDYCDTYPLSDGPNRTANIYCWLANKSTTWSYNSHVAPKCEGASAQAGMSPGAKLGLVAGALVVGAYLFTRRR